jgi:exodeoxyribonuclease VII large subunit
LNRKQQQIRQCQQQLERAALRLFQQRRDRLLYSRHLLHSVSPLAVLERGYAIVRNDRNQVVKSTAELTRGEPVRVRLAQGEFTAQVTRIVDS